MRQFVNQIQWEISHNNSQKAGASKIHFFAKDTPDLNFKERADQWQQLKENKPEEIKRYQNLLDDHNHKIYKARLKPLLTSSVLTPPSSVLPAVKELPF